MHVLLADASDGHVSPWTLDDCSRPSITIESPALEQERCKHGEEEIDPYLQAHLGKTKLPAWPCILSLLDIRLHNL